MYAWLIVLKILILVLFYSFTDFDHSLYKIIYKCIWFTWYTYSQSFYGVLAKQRHLGTTQMITWSWCYQSLNQYIQLKWTLTVRGKVLTWVDLLFLSYHNSVCFLKFLFYLIINKLTIIFFCFRYIFFSFIVIFFTLVLYVLNTLLRFIFRRIGPACAVLKSLIRIITINDQ